MLSSRKPVTGGLCVYSLCILLSALMCLIASVASAAELLSPDEIHWRVESMQWNFRVETDGSCVEERQVVARLIDEQGRAFLQTATIFFNPTLQSGELTAAWVLKKNGRRIDVPRSSFEIEQQAGATSTVADADANTLIQATFPPLEIGDRIAYTSRIATRVPAFGGHFSQWFALDRSRPLDNLRLSMDLPESLALRIASNGVKLILDAHHDGRRKLEWEWSNPSPVRITSRQIFAHPERGPYVAVTSFNDYQQIAQAYSNAIRPHGAIKPGVQALAAHIAGDLTDKRDVARALYEWVVRHIDTRGECVISAALPPRDLEKILQAGSGNCTDHAALLLALLAARGIESTPALLQTGNRDRLPQLPDASLFDHVITYIPALDLYIDSTEPDTPFGALPDKDGDSPVLLADGNSTNRRTPAVATRSGASSPTTR